jgi:hypothetical protein
MIPAASGLGIKIIASHRRRPVSTYEALDSGLRSKLPGIEPEKMIKTKKR